MHTYLMKFCDLAIVATRRAIVRSPRGQYAMSWSGTELVIYGVHASAGTPATEAAIRDPNFLFNYQATLRTHTTP
jgi:hypothetical protein